MTREKIAWNDNWMFSREFSKQMTEETYDDTNMEAVELPHTNKLLQFHYFNETDYQMICGYRKVFVPEEEWKGKEICVFFEAVGHFARVYFNGVELTSHLGGYTGFYVELTSHLQYGRENVLCVMADSRENLNIPPFGNVVDYMTYGGIYREVFLEVREEVYLEDLFLTTGLRADDERRLYSEIRIKGQGRVELIQTLYGEESILASLEESGEITEEGTLFIKTMLHSPMMEETIRLWTPETPQIYELKTQIRVDNQIIEERVDRVGFRRIRFEEDGFYLNGEKYTIRGLNRHQAYPNIGYAAPKRLQRQDALILKKELGLNAVRTSHYPQSRHFLDACDEIGLLVFTELPGWQHIGDEEWKQVALQNLEEMIVEQRNHPSIFIWGVRINESADDETFYLEANKRAHRLDPTRQTGGVRFIQNSQLLEDVYTYNDFSHRGDNPGIEQKKQVTSDRTKPYLITEYNGHMFPTKSFDNEERRMEHAKRHASVMNAYYGEAGVAGGFGWCMADYNTHQDFGSGDRICYHGVLDQFRNPKPAAAVYKSQQGEEEVLHIPSSLNIGEHNGGYLPDFYAYTNADSIRLYKNDLYVKEFFPDLKNFPSLRHPPVLIDDFVGELMQQGEGYPVFVAEGLKEVLKAVGKYGQNSLPLKYKLKMLRLMLFHKITLQDGIRLYNTYVANWGGKTTTYRFEAIKEGKVVAIETKEPVTDLKLQVKTDLHLTTKEESYDMTLVRICARDQNDNVLPFYQEPLLLEATGAIELVGNSIISLRGGMGGFYVKTNHKTGRGSLKITGTQIPETILQFEVD